MKKLLLIFSALTIIGALTWFWSTRKPINYDPVHSTTLFVGTSSDYPPFSFIKNNELTGFDINVAQEIARRLNKNIVFKDMPFTTLIPELQSGKIHIIAAGMAPTEERAKRILFTKPYIIDDFVIITPSKYAIKNLDELQGKEVVVNEGYDADNYMTQWGRASLIRLTSPADAFLALKTGRAIAYVDANIPVQPFFEKYGREQFNTLVLPSSGTTIALGLSPKYPEFLSIIQNILDAMQADGTLEQLKKKWNLL